MSTELLGDDGVRVRRVIQAPPEEVFEAWTAPERLRTWWGPPGFSVGDLDADLRVGGRYRIVMEGPDGLDRVLLWDFREIDPPRRLVYSWRWERGDAGDEETVVIVEFRDLGGRTEIVLEHSGFTSDPVREHHVAGWEACADRLERLLRH